MSSVSEGTVMFTSSVCVSRKGQGPRLRGRAGMRTLSWDSARTRAGIGQSRGLAHLRAHCSHTHPSLLAIFMECVRLRLPFQFLRRLLIPHNYGEKDRTRLWNQTLSGYRSSLCSLLPPLPLNSLGFCFCLSQFCMCLARAQSCCDH